MTLPLITIDNIIAWNPCAEYGRARLEEFFGVDPFNALDILSKTGPSQDKLFSIMREETLGVSGLAQVDEWVCTQFTATPALTISGQNCKNNWPQPTEFQRAVMLSDLMRHETGSDTAFEAQLRLLLEGM